MFLIIKVNASIDLRLFQGTLKHLQARRTKTNYRRGEGGYQLMKNVGHYGCLNKKNCQFKLSKMARNTYNILRGK